MGGNVVPVAGSYAEPPQHKGAESHPPDIVLGLAEPERRHQLHSDSSDLETLTLARGLPGCDGGKPTRSQPPGTSPVSVHIPS